MSALKSRLPAPVRSRLPRHQATAPRHPRRRPEGDGPIRVGGVGRHACQALPAPGAARLRLPDRRSRRHDPRDRPGAQRDPAQAGGVSHEDGRLPGPRRAGREVQGLHAVFARPDRGSRLRDPGGGVDGGRDRRPVRPGARVARAGAQPLAHRLHQRLREPAGPERRPGARRARPSLLFRPVSRALVDRAGHRRVDRGSFRPHRRHDDGVRAQRRDAWRHHVVGGGPRREVPVRPRPRQGQGEVQQAPETARTSTCTTGSSRPTTCG